MIYFSYFLQYHKNPILFVYMYILFAHSLSSERIRIYKFVFLMQRTASSSSLASSNGNPAEIKIETSLIDFDAAPEPPAPAAMPQPQQSATGLPVAQNLPSSGDNWANFDSVSEVKASQAPVSANSLESVLSELSMPASNPGPTTVGSLGLPFGAVAPPAAGVNSSATFPSGAPVANPGLVHSQPNPAGNSFGNAVAQGPWQQQQTHYLFPAVGGQPSARNFMPAPVGPSSSQVYFYFSFYVNFFFVIL